MFRLGGGRMFCLRGGRMFRFCGVMCKGDDAVEMVFGNGDVAFVD